MRTLALLFCAVCEVFAQTGRIEGRVVTPDGKPIPKATVRLNPASPQTGSNVYVEVTSSDGRFTVENVTAGTYSINAQRAGYTLPAAINTRAAPVTVSPNETRGGIEVKLNPLAVVGGFVIDADGDPVAGAMVRLLRNNYSQGRTILAAAATATTDDRGQFRMANVQEGRYYLVVNGGPVAPSGLMNEVRGRSAQETNQLTYYPSSATVEGATKINVKAGAVENLPMRMRRGMSFSIKGTVDWPGGTPPSIQILSKSSDSTSFAMGAAVRPTGQFETAAVPPGDYTLLARYNTPPAAPGVQPKLLTGRVDVTVSNGNVENVSIRLIEGIELSGRISIEGAGDIASFISARMPDRPVPSVETSIMNARAPASALPPPNPRLPAITLSAAENLPASVSRIAIAEDGTFRVPNVTPMKYNLNIANLPPGVYLKSVRMGGQDVMRSFLDLSSGPSGPIDIVLSPNAASLMVSMPGSLAQQYPAQTGPGFLGPQASIWPALPNRSTQNGGASVMFLNPQAPTRMQNLAPGDYYVVTWEEPAPMDVAGIPDFLMRFKDSAAKVTVKEGETAAVEPKVISGEAMRKVLNEFP